MPDGSVFELDNYDISEQYQVVQAASEVVSATVKKMRVATFVSDLLLQDVESPFVHDAFPYVPFVGYLDRFKRPFGIPRPIKEQNMEVNKRRSMALSLVSNRRVIIEKGAAEDINKVYQEANRTDGFIVLKPGKKHAFEIQELGDLANSQLALLNKSEEEIKEISGTSDESLGYGTPVQSGTALDRKQRNQATVISSLLENTKYSLKDLGEKITSLVQNNWTEEKVLRVVDRVTGVEAFVAVNERVLDDSGEVVGIKNDLTQSRFDLVIATKPITDTMREKNIDLLFSAINSSPPEAVGPLLNLALEISDIPNKDQLLKQIRAATGVPPIDENLSASEREAQEKETAQIAKQRQDAEYAQKAQGAQVEMAERSAKTEKLRADALAALKNAETAKQKVTQEGFKIGQEAVQKNSGAR